MVCAGWKPGWSTDYCATLICQDYGAKTIINLTNISQVYRQDPRKNPRAKPVEKISWPDYRKLIGSKWTPGMNAPFDPIASLQAEKLKLKVIILNGRDFVNLKNYFQNKKFQGTIIE